MVANPAHLIVYPGKRHWLVLSGLNKLRVESYDAFYQHLPGSGRALSCSSPRTPKVHPSRGPAPTFYRTFKKLLMLSNLSLTSTTLLEYFSRVIAITSALAPLPNRLTDIEVQTLALFLSLPKEHEYYPFSPRARKLVTSLYDGKITIQLLSARLTSLIEKGYLVRDEDGFIDFAPQIRKLKNTTSFNALLSYKSASGADLESNKNTSTKSK